MQVEYTLLDPTLPEPAYQTAGSVAFDLCAARDITINPKQIELVPTGVIIKTPENYALILAPRSSLPRKKGLLLPNSIGIIDQDYCGEKDEIMCQLYNFTDQPVELKKGERICQVLFVQIAKVELIHKDKLSDTSRGGFGSTAGYHN